MMISNAEPRNEINELRKDYIREKGYSIEKMWECSWWDQFKNNVDVKNHVRTHFSFKRLLSANSQVQNIRNETKLGYVQCDLSVRDELKSKLSNFPPNFENIDVIRNDIGEYMESYAKKKRFVKTTAKNVDIELQIDLRNTYHTTFQLLLGSWTTVYKHSLFCTIHTA